MSKNRYIINVCAGIISQENQFLICQRSEAHFKRAWEFPGGKTEEFESHQEALKRELYEELGIHCTIGQHFHTVFHKSGYDKQINLHTYLIESHTNKPFCKVHAQLKWVTIEEMIYYNFLPADLPIVENLISLHKKRVNGRSH